MSRQLMNREEIQEQSDIITEAIIKLVKGGEAEELVNMLSHHMFTLASGTTDGIIQTATEEGDSLYVSVTLGNDGRGLVQ